MERSKDLALGMNLGYCCARPLIHRTGDVDQSLRRTTATAGRTVLVSGVAVAAVLSEALAAEGEHGALAAAARRFLARHPRDPHAARVRELAFIEPPASVP